jgi:hypothetical protein
MTDIIQTSVTSTQANTQPTLIGSQLPATVALQNLLSQNLQGQLMNTYSMFALSLQDSRVFDQHRGQT